jgi:glycosyltransferase involved in cell wall biosynthesis
MWVYPTALHRLRDVNRMRRTLATADAIVMNTRESARLVRRRFPELADRLVVAIPNGFDPADFAGPAPERTDHAFRIVHTGYLHTALGRDGRLRRRLGGATAPANILTRSHVFLLRAIERLLAEDPSLEELIEVHLAGVTSDADRRAGTHPVIHFRGYLPHFESVALLRSADLLFLPLHDLPPGRRLSIVPGKTYEYLASGTPILAAVPDGDARELLARAGTSRLCRPDDVEAMADILRDEIARFRADGRRPPVPRSPELLRYGRRYLSGELAGVFDRVVRRSGVARRSAA